MQPGIISRLAIGIGLLAAGGSVRAAEALVRVSVPNPGSATAYGGGSSTISADGRFVAFDSYADDIIYGDNNRTWDVFVRDVDAGTTQRVSVTSQGYQANGPSHSPAMTPDGRFVAFWSKASNLASGDTNNAWDVYLRDRQEGSIQRVSLGPGSGQGAGDAQALGRVSVSDDGRFVAFASAAALASGDTDGRPDIYVRDTAANTTLRATVSTTGAAANNLSAAPAISGDGRFVVFASYASNLVSGDTNGTADIFVRDLPANTTRRVSVSASGAEANAWSGEPSISADGRYVAFESFASNLAAGDVYQTGDVFVKDTVSGAVTRIGPPAGSRERGASFSARISADGGSVALLSSEALVDDAYPASRGLYVRNLRTGDTARVALPPSQAGAAFRADLPAISADGRFVAFQSGAVSPTDAPALARYDVYVRDLSIPLVPSYTLADVISALHLAAGLTPATPADLARLNVVPEEVPTIDLQDAVVLARKSNGLES